MYKSVVLLTFLLLRLNGISQTVFIADTGNITFYSYAPIEDIKATSYQVNSVINTITGEIAFMIPIRSFLFEKALMQEHFNEKYMQSDKYPQSTFTGKVIDLPDFSKPGIYEVASKGILKLHGKEKDISAKGLIEVANEQVILNSEFNIALKEFDIAIPHILFRNIADTINVKMKAVYVPFKK